MEENFKCNKCEKEFGTKEALESHKNSKHYEVKVVSSKINKKIKNWLIFTLLIVAIILVAFFLSNQPKDPTKFDSFAKCLTEKNISMYGAFWCPHCQEQKEAFGESFQYVNYIECSNPDRSMNKICQDAEINGYPTWKFGDGVVLEGYVLMKDLSTRSGCELP